MAQGIVNSGGGGFGRKLDPLATSEHILSGYQALTPKGKVIVGNIPIYGADDEIELIEVKVGEEYTIPEGYYKEGAVIIANEKLQFLNGTASAADVLSNKTIMINGEPVQGTIPIRSIADIVKIN